MTANAVSAECSHPPKGQVLVISPSSTLLRCTLLSSPHDRQQCTGAERLRGLPRVTQQGAEAGSRIVQLPGVGVTDPFYSCRHEAEW